VAVVGASRGASELRQVIEHRNYERDGAANSLNLLRLLVPRVDFVR
jgi:hypothetical protein